MREVVLRLPRIAVEDVLDRLLPLVPGGVGEGRDGGHAELRMRGPDVPSGEVIAAAVGRWPHTLAEREVSDDWRERRVADYEPDVIGGRLIVRPEWAPVPPPGALDIVLAESAAFGSGTHPTTRMCLELLLTTAPIGAFADLGCGSGVLAIVAARLGWAPVMALDIDPSSVETAAGNAARNDVAIDVQVGDLASDPPPPAAGFAANVPAALHHVIAARLDPVPAFGLCSGFGAEDVDDVTAAYRARGLGEQRRDAASGWSMLVLRDG
ncbi:MAG: 50S ribosomal protein L11 methyltransferase [Solirubrobacteraceae bacterium]